MLAKTGVLLLLNAVITAVAIGGKQFSINDCVLSVGVHNVSFDLLWIPENDRVRIQERGNVLFSPCPEKTPEKCNGSDLCIISNYSEVFYDIKDAAVQAQDGFLAVLYEERSSGGRTVGKKTVEIVYICSDDLTLAHSNVGNDNIKMIWRGPVGCPIKNDLFVRNVCWFNSQESTYDLRSLKNSPLTTSTENNKELVLNLCGGSACPHRAALCEKDLTSGTVTEVITKGLPFTMEPQRRNRKLFRGEISFDFDESPPDSRLKVLLFCDDHSTTHAITEAKKNDSTQSIVVKVVTPLACPIMRSPCKYENFRRGTYDLSPLGSSANRHLETNDGGVVLLNICQPLNYEPESSCTGGSVIGCYQNSTFSAILGTRMTVNESSNGLHLVLEGAPCSGEVNYTTNIDVVCSNVEKGPKLHKFEHCNVHIEWYSSAGCPTEYKATNDDCVISHPLAKEASLNFTQLFSQGAVSVSVPPLRSTFWLNLCRPFIDACGTADNVSVCMVRQEDGVAVPIGYSSVELVASHGLVQFKIFGAPCRRDFVSSQTIIIMKCHFSAKDQLKFIAEDRCRVTIEWYSRHACPYNKNEAHCSIYNRDTGQFYDLARLVSPSQNLVAPVNSTHRLELALCQNLIPVGCDYENKRRSCLVGTTNPLEPTFHVAGWFEDRHELKIVDRSVILSLGDASEANCGSLGYSTILNFTCGPKKMQPTVELNECTFYVQIIGPEVCPVNVPSVNHCKLDNKYDLTSLANKEWTTSEGPFKLSICGPLSSFNKTKVTVLLNEQSPQIYGLPNSPLLLDKQTDTLFFNYTTERDLYSLIYLTCGVENALVSTSPLYLPALRQSHYAFNISTPYACRYLNENNCCPIVGGLCSSKGHFRVDANGTWVVLGVCESQAVCNGSLACSSDQLSLGRVLKGPTTSINGTVELVYLKGDPCQNNKSEDMSTVLYLECAQSPAKLKDEPKFVKIRDECQYVFKWSSSRFCPRLSSSSFGASRSLMSTDSCPTVQKEPRLGDLLLNEFEYELISEKTGSRYTIDLCSSIRRQSANNGCDRSICHVNADGTKTPTGLTFHSMTSTVDDLVINYFSHNKACHCTVKFLCNLDVYLGKPKIALETGCNLDVVWETQLFCPSNSRSPSTVMDQIQRPFNYSYLWAWASIGIVIVLVIAVRMLWRRRRKYARLSRPSSGYDMNESSEFVTISDPSKLD